MRWLWRLAFFFMVLVSCGLASLALAGWVLSADDGLAQAGAPDLNLLTRVYLQAYLQTRTEELAAAAGPSAVPVQFTIAPGETAETIAANLAQAGALHDPTLLVNYLRYYGLDSALEAGEFTLSPGLTVPELAQQLTRALAREAQVRFVEGWRLEEMARHLLRNPVATVDADEFLALAQGRAGLDVKGYAFLASRPPGASLEGYLFPDTYRLPLDADASFLVEQMLENFGRRVDPAMRQSYGVHGLSLHEAVTLASIVEREAVVATERPLIAGVFYNRLAQDMRLEADPTTQYALGLQPETDSWWKSPLTRSDLQHDSPYNTYVVTGLPPGPIASPGLSALQAVAAPAESEYLFFVVDCTAPTAGAHAFSTSFEEHLAHVSRCR